MISCLGRGEFQAWSGPSVALHKEFFSSGVTNVKKNYVICHTQSRERARGRGDVNRETARDALTYNIVSTPPSSYIHIHICLSIHMYIPSIHSLCVHPSIHSSFYSYIRAHMQLFIHTFINLYIHPFILQSINESVNQSIHSSIHPCLFIYMSIHPTIRM